MRSENLPHLSGSLIRSTFPRLKTIIVRFYQTMGHGKVPVPLAELHGKLDRYVNVWENYVTVVEIEWAGISKVVSRAKEYQNEIAEYLTLAFAKRQSGLDHEQAPTKRGKVLKGRILWALTET